MIDLASKFGRKVKRHLKSEYIIWLTTLGADLTPQPRPVWFLWDEGTILIYSQPNAGKVRHLESHNRVALNFNTDAKGEMDVAVILGTAEIDVNAPPAHKMRAYLKKYHDGILALKMTPQQFGDEYSTAIRVTPSSVRGW